MKASLISALLTAILAGSLPSPSCGEGVVVQWEKIYNGPVNGDDFARSLAVDSAGNAIVTGYYGTNIGFNGVEFYTAKYSAVNGVLLWEKRYGPGWGTEVAVDRADNVIVIGRVGDYGSDHYTAKFAAASGVLLWQRRFNELDNNPQNEATALSLDDAGNVIVTGITDNDSATVDDIYTAKYAASNGALVWEHRFNRQGARLSDEVANDVAVDRDGNAIVTGRSGSRNLGFDYYTAKLAAADGALIWDTLSRNPRRLGSGQSVAVDSEGNAIVTGGSQLGYRTAKYAAADGTLVWEVIYNGPGDADEARRVRVDSEGNAVVTGHSVGSSGKTNIYTAKYAGEDGALLWEKRSNEEGLAYRLVLDHAGNAIVNGYTKASDGIQGIYTAKYAVADGTLLWEKRYKGTGPDGSGGAGVAVDLHGNTVVTGVVRGAGGNIDWYTAKYVEADADFDGLLDSWEVEHFGGTAAHTALDDSDGDGTVELLELAFGTDPRAPDSVPAPAVVINGGYLTTTITKQPCVRYVVETGATLESGFSAASTTVLIDSATTLKVRDNVLVGTQAARFLRVRVTAPP